ncbi:tetratricopeptide repeat protein [Aureliella helgolandensis]|uniref:Uncharacterized protein n=1 Tax=Aureliella helgolandensis TaxID=2527968 RepID=A0A518GBD6_9BACT|nr:hypothetical protein [Aureliella helgolandensis]QDV25926.1 hypothetical protein Q31a_42940 [Aureliella helgolandensis]
MDTQHTGPGDADRCPSQNESDYSLTKPLVARTSSWWRLCSVLAVLFSLQGAGAYFAGLPGLVAATMMYFVLKVLLQRRAKSFQKAGLRLMAEERYREAAAMFEAGYQYFSDRRWADRYRAISMLDYSGMDWREIMLANMATNMALAGDRERAIQLYQQCLELYPDSRLAKPALRFLMAGTDG